MYNIWQCVRQLGVQQATLRINSGVNIIVNDMKFLYLTYVVYLLPQPRTTKQAKIQKANEAGYSSICYCFIKYTYSILFKPEHWLYGLKHSCYWDNSRCCIKSRNCNYNCVARKKKNIEALILQQLTPNESSNEHVFFGRFSKHLS